MDEKNFNLTQTGQQVQDILNSAKSTDQVLTEIQEAMENLPDGQAVSAQVALNTSAIQELDANKASKTEVENDYAKKTECVFDISAYHATGTPPVLETYADLTAALGTDGANIPEALRKGGMSVKFVQSSDNKYVQYRFLLSGSFTAAQFVDPANWQGVDTKPAPKSINLVESGEVWKNEAQKIEVAINTTFVVNFLALKEGDVIEILVQNTEQINDNARYQGLYFNNTLVMGMTKNEFINGKSTIFTAQADGNLGVRTETSGDTVDIWYFLNGEGLHLSSKKIDTLTQEVQNLNLEMQDVEEIAENVFTTHDFTGVTESSGVTYLDVLLKKGVKYTLYFKVTNPEVTETSNYTGIYYKVGTTPTRIAGPTAAQFNAGYTFDYTPLQDGAVGLRPDSGSSGFSWIASVTCLYPEKNAKEIEDLAGKVAINKGNIVNAIDEALIKYGKKVLFPNVGTIYNGEVDSTKTDRSYSDPIPVGKGLIYINFYVMSYNTPISFYDSSHNYLGQFFPGNVTAYKIIRSYEGSFEIPANTAYIRICSVNSHPTTAYVNFVENKSPWNNKNVVVYGDSITALDGGDNLQCINSYFYQAYLNNVMNNIYCRGIGGQTYIWNTYGWYTGTGMNGKLLDRYKYDAEGNRINEVVNPATITAEEIANIEAKWDTQIEVHYGSFCSWDRIKTMIPDAIRNTIDLVILCGGTNDFSAVEEVEVEGDMSALEPEWIANDQTDPTWAADTSNYKGGDYDITTFQGAIASTVMKMQTWCPNAIVVIATPFPRFNKTTKMQYVNTSGLKFRRMCEIQLAVAGFIGADVIDANGRCEINGVNFGDYQTDGVHPNILGRRVFGRVFTGLMNSVYPKS